MSFKCLTRALPIYLYLLVSFISSISSFCLADSSIDSEVTEFDYNLSLDDALFLSLKSNSSILGKKQEVDRAVLDYELTKGYYAFDFEAGISFVRNKVDIDTQLLGTETRDTNNETIEFNIIFPWWHKSDIKYDAAKKLIDIELKKHSLESSILSIELAVYKAYFEVVLKEEMLKSAERNLSDAKKRYDSVLAQLNMGRSSKHDEITERSNVLNHEVNVEEKSIDLQNAKDKLINLIGFSSEELDFTRILLTDRLKRDSTGMPSLDVKDAIKHHITKLELEIEQKRIDIKSVNSKWKPRLSARVAYSPKANSVGSNNTEYTDLINYGLYLKVPFPKYKTSSIEKKLYNHDLNELLNEKQQAMIDVVKTARQLQERASRIERKIVLLSELVQEKSKEVKSSRESFALGKISNLELQMVESVMINAESRLYQSLNELTNLYGDIRIHYGINLIDAFDSLAE